MTMRRAEQRELITIAGRILIVAASQGSLALGVKDTRKGHCVLGITRWSLAAHMINNLMDSRMGILYSGPSRDRSCCCR